MNLCRKYVLVLLLIRAVIPLSAQHNIIYRNHQIHQVMVNPATAGSAFVPVAVLSFQKQWLGINQSPSTLIASTSLRIGNLDFYDPKMMINNPLIKSKDQIGLGFGIYSDQNGPLASRGLNLAYAYHIRLLGSRSGIWLIGKHGTNRD